jgi:hypothetical protein
MTAKLLGANEKPHLWKFEGHWNCIGKSLIAQGWTWREAYESWVTHPKVISWRNKRLGNFRKEVAYQKSLIEPIRNG